MRKKIIFIIEALSGGAGRHVKDLMLNIDNATFESILIYGSQRTDVELLKNLSSFELYECPSLAREIDLKKDFESVQFINKIIRKIEPDIIHCHSTKAGVVGRIAAKRNHIKKIFYTPHAYSFLAPEFSNIKKKLFVLIEHFLSKYATTKTFCVSNGEKKNALERHIDRSEKISVIYNGLPEIKFENKREIKIRLGLQANDFVVGNNARMSAQKNPMLFMEIAKAVIEQNDKFHFVWVGDGVLMSTVKEYIFNNGLEKNVHLLGNRKDSELMVAGYDVFMLTSLYEGLPYAPIEALRAGVPIYSTNVIGSNEVVFEGENGEFINGDYLNSLKKISELSNIKSEFKKKFDIDIMINKIMNEYTY